MGAALFSHVREAEAGHRKHSPYVRLISRKTEWKLCLSNGFYVSGLDDGLIIRSVMCVCTRFVVASCRFS